MESRVLCLLLVLVASACQVDPTPVSQPTRTATPSLVPYQAVEVATATQQPALLPAATRTPLPTPTPFTYTVEEGDTLLTIAFRFSVSVNDIVAVNPGVDSRFLSIGQVLVIPIGEGAETVIASPTPVPLVRGAPVCYPDAYRGLWCFVTVLNELPLSVEGVEAEVSLYRRDGQRVAVRVAYPPVNRIEGGEAVPLIAYFSPPLPDNLLPRAFLRQAFVPGPAEAVLRYLAHQVGPWEFEIGEDATEASVRGTVILSEPIEEPLDLSVTVVGIAYSVENVVVGLRRWELTAGSAEVSAGLDFQFSVYSLGPPIAEVELYSEIRPAPAASDGAEP